MPEPTPAGEPGIHAGGGSASIGAVWAVRAFAGLCIVAGLYVACVSLHRISGGDPGGTWLLPLATGALAVILGSVIGCERELAVIAHADVVRRAGAVILLGTYAVVLLPVLGFLVASIALVLAVTAWCATRKLAVGLGGLLIVAGLWAFFAFVLSEPLPRGLWW